jgi:hypothetical protein
MPVSFGSGCVFIFLSAPIATQAGVVNTESAVHTLFFYSSYTIHFNGPFCSMERNRRERE